MDKKKGQIEYDLIVRDHEGVVLATQSTTKNFLATHEMAGVLTTLYVVETSKEMGFHDIILERDAIQIVNVNKMPGNNWSSIGHIVDDIKLELKRLRSWRIDHVKRGANKQLIP